jgi:hypothetical protein
VPRYDLNRGARNSDEFRDKAAALFIGGAVNRRGRNSDLDGPIVLACEPGLRRARLDPNPERYAVIIGTDFDHVS